MRSLILPVLIGVTAYLSATRAEEAPAPLAENNVTAMVPHMITVDVKLIEVSRTKMRELGVDFTTFDGQRGKKVDGGLAVQQMSSSASVGFVEALVKNRVARKIAEPRIAVTSGREAQLSAGSQSEASEAEAGANEQAGIELRMTPTLLADGRVQVELFVKYSWQEQATDESATDNQVRHFSLDTSVVSAPKESSLISGLVLEDSDDSYVLIVTPELLKSTAVAPRQSITK